MTEPHHAHLLEMRASQRDASATDELIAGLATVPCRALTGAELRAARDRYAADREADLDAAGADGGFCPCCFAHLDITQTKCLRFNSERL